MPKPKKNDPAAALAFEAKLWQTANALRNNMDEAEYKHVVIGLSFLKYISDAFEEQHAANSPFKVSDWHGELVREDKHWQEGVPPAGNAITSGLIPA